MALRKDFNWKGFIAHHWHIVKYKTVCVGNNDGVTVCTFAVWKDKQTYQQQTDKSKRGFMLPVEIMFSFPGELSQQECYQLVKTTELTIEGVPNPLFGATDDF